MSHYWGVIINESYWVFILFDWFSEINRQLFVDFFSPYSNTLELSVDRIFVHFFESQQHDWRSNHNHCQWFIGINHESSCNHYQASDDQSNKNFHLKIHVFCFYRVRLVEIKPWYNILNNNLFFQSWNILYFDNNTLVLYTQFSDKLCSLYRNY